jgi:Sec-independent protein translocase protein TatA
MRIDKRVLIKLGQLIAIMLLAMAVFGCSKYPKATSRESMDFIKQVYTACNTKKVERLAACKERLAELESEQKISTPEIQSFEHILELASQGDWETAQSMALKLAQDQVR